MLKLAIPLVLSTASLTLMLFVDRLFLSWHSQSAVAASTPGGITYFTICSLFLGTAQYVNAIVAQHHGAGDKPACARAVWQGVIFSVLSTPVILAMIPVEEQLWIGAATGAVGCTGKELFFRTDVGRYPASPQCSAFLLFFPAAGEQPL